MSQPKSRESIHPFYQRITIDVFPRVRRCHHSTPRLNRLRLMNSSAVYRLNFSFLYPALATQITLIDIAAFKAHGLRAVGP